MLPRVDRPGTLEKVVTALTALTDYLTRFETPQRWAALTLRGDWVRNSATINNPDFVVDPLGRVELRGAVSTVGGASDDIGVLPVNARPVLAKRFCCAAIVGGVPLAATVNVSAAGLIEIISPAVGVNTLVWLDGIRFDTRS